MGMRRFKPRRSFSRRSGPHYEVSQFSSTVAITVAASTTAAAPLQAFVRVIDQSTIMAAPAAVNPVVFDSSIRGISVRRVHYASSLALVESVVPAVVAYTRVYESVSVDAPLPPGLLIPVHQPTGFLAEVGSGDAPALEAGGTLGGFPNRTLFRRWGLYPVGGTNFTSVTPITFFDPINFAPKTIRGKVFLKDQDTLWACLSLTNPTLFDLDYVWIVQGVVTYRVVR